MRPSVLVLTPWFPTPEQPLLGNFVVEHCLTLAPHADVCVVHAVGAVPGQAQRRSLEPVRDPPSGLRTYRLSIRPSRLRGLATPRWLSAALWAYRQLGPFDLAHAHTFKGAIMALPLRAAFGLPFVYTEHMSRLNDEGTISRAEWLQVRACVSAASCVLPVSHALARRLAERGLRPRRSAILGNPVDLDCFGPPIEPSARTAPRLLFVGRLEARKGPGELLTALQQRGAGVELDLVGDGPERARLETRAEGLGDRVRFHGSLTKAGVAQLMRQVDLLVVPSRRETFGCVVAEALVSGVPALVSPDPALGELIGPGDGWRAAGFDSASLATTLGQALTELPTLDRPAIAKRAARRFGSETFGQRLAAVYAQAIEGSHERTDS